MSEESNLIPENVQPNICYSFNCKILCETPQDSYISDSIKVCHLGFSFCPATSNVSWLSGLFTSVLPLEIQQSRGEGRDLISLLTLPHFCMCPKLDLDFQCHMSWSLYVQWFRVWGDCLFCWYWWNFFTITV
jgi:hypothetical protein